MSGNFRVKCIGVDNHRGGYYTVGKIYNVVDGVLKSDYNAIIFRDLKSLDDLQEKSSAKWKLVEEHKTKLIITVDDEIATISDGNDIIEVENNINSEELLVGELVKEYYYNQEKNKIKVGDSVSITNTICYRYHEEFIVDNAQELIDRMGLVEFSNLLLKFNSGNIPFLNGKYKVHLMAKHTNINKELVIISDDSNTFIINIDNLKKIDNQIGVTMNNKTIKDIVSIAEHYDYERQARQLTEEMAELTVALNKQWRAFKDKAPINETVNLNGKVYEELADVFIMLKQIIYLGDCKREVDDIIKEKVKRQLKRIKGESDDSVW